MRERRLNRLARALTAEWPHGLRARHEVTQRALRLTLEALRPYPEAQEAVSRALAGDAEAVAEAAEAMGRTAEMEQALRAVERRARLTVVD